MKIITKMFFCLLLIILSSTSFAQETSLEVKPLEQCSVQLNFSQNDYQTSQGRLATALLRLQKLQIEIVKLKANQKEEKRK